MPATKFDVNVVPSNFTAPWLKAFFRVHYQIPVRVNCGKHYVNAWIAGSEFKFSPELGNLCMRAVYHGSEKLSAQAWGGNVTPYSISMTRREWVQVLSGLLQEA